MTTIPPSNSLPWNRLVSAKKTHPQIRSRRPNPDRTNLIRFEPHHHGQGTTPQPPNPRHQVASLTRPSRDTPEPDRSFDLPSPHLTPHYRNLHDPKQTSIEESGSLQTHVGPTKSRLKKVKGLAAGQGGRIQCFSQLDRWR